MSRAKTLKVCTHCGNTTTCNEDHVFPSQLNVDRDYPHSAKRAIKVPSCLETTCNGRSDEVLLQDFFAAGYDFSFVDKRLPHLTTPMGRQDLLNALKFCIKDISSIEQWISQDQVKTGYIDERLTGIFKKMFMGMRRAILKNQWAFLGREHFYLFWIQQYQQRNLMWVLPEVVGVQNICLPLPKEWEAGYVTDQQYRDFHFGKGKEDLYFLRYGVCDNTAVPPFFLVCLAKDVSAIQNAQGSASTSS